ncbi:MAG: DUF2511 domain-containing protein [Gammaproteobacteria bacterium]|nr:DUF2511 domain-containing protein [Gammaproteobacteria bacterium]
MKWSVVPILVFLLISQANADYFCYYIVEKGEKEKEGRIISYKTPPWDLSYPPLAPISPKEMERRKKKGRFIISVNPGQCGGIPADELFAEYEEDLFDRRSRTEDGSYTEDMDAGLPESDSFATDSKPLPVNKPAVISETPTDVKPVKQILSVSKPLPVSETPVITEAAIREIIQAMDKASQRKDVAEFTRHLAPWIFLVNTDKVSGQAISRETTRAKYAEELSQVWKQNERFEIEHKNPQITLGSDGKSAASHSELVVTVAPGTMGGDAYQMFMLESATYASINKKTLITETDISMMPMPVQAPVAEVAETDLGADADAFASESLPEGETGVESEMETKLGSDALASAARKEEEKQDAPEQKVAQSPPEKPPAEELTAELPPPADVQTAPSSELIKKPPADAQAEAPLELKEKPPADAQAEPPLELKEKPPADAQAEPPLELKEKPPADAQAEPPIELKEEPPADAQAEPPLGLKEEPPADAQAEPPLELKEKAPEKLSPAPKKVKGSITEAEFGRKWPFTVSHGILKCTSPNIVTFEANGKTYAVNPPALAQGHVDVEEIWKDYPGIPGSKITLGSVIKKGLAACK